MNSQTIIPEAAGTGRDELIPFVKELCYSAYPIARPSTTYGTAALYMQETERGSDGYFYRKADNKYYYRASAANVRRLVHELASSQFPRREPGEEWASIRQRLQVHIMEHRPEDYVESFVWTPDFLRRAIRSCRHRDSLGSVFWTEMLFVCVCDCERMPEAVMLLKVAQLMFGRRVAFGAVVTIMRFMVHELVTKDYESPNSGHALKVLGMMADMALFDRLVYPGVDLPIPSLPEMAEANARFYVECLFHMEAASAAAGEST
jgi:hypothetical protein